MKKIITLCVLLLGAVVLQAEEPDKKPKTDAMLFGDVKSGGKHIPFATITIKGTTIGTAADATGHFKISNLPVGKQIIVISAIGFKTVEKEVVFESNKSVTLLVELMPDNIGIDQVVVSADRNLKSRRETPTIVSSINPKLFQRTQNVTLSDGLNFAPGLRMENNCQNCGFSQLRINGMEGPYSQILINSRPVFSGLAGVYGLELIPANMIERVEVIRGGGSALYGSNAIAGTVNLITKDPVSNSFSVSSSLRTVGAGLRENSGGTQPDYNLNFNGSFVSDDFKSGMNLYGFSRNRKPFDANDDGFSEVPLIENTTLGARVYQRIMNRGKITLDYFNINESRRGGNKFELPCHEADIAESVQHKINSGSLTFDLLLRESDKFSIFFSAQNVDRKSYYGANQDLAAYGATKDFTYSSGILYIRQFDNFLFAPATFTSGIEFNGSGLTDNSLGYFNPAENEHYGNTLIARQQSSTKAVFTQVEWKINNVVFNTGIRYDRYLITDKTNETTPVSGNVLSPRISFLYNVSKHLQFRSGYTGGFRAPQIFDEDLHIETSGSRKVIHRNAENLKQETSGSLTASIDYSNYFGKWQVQFLAESFYTKLINPFANKIGIPDENGVVIYVRENAEKGATVKGINFELNASPSGKFQCQSGFTMQRSLYEEPREFGERHFFRSPNSYGYFSLNYKPQKNFKFSFTGNYSGSMLVPYFGTKATDSYVGELHKSQSFFDAGIKLSYYFEITDMVGMELTGGFKNMFNSYQKDFDSGKDRDPAYIYGPILPRTVYFGLKFGNIF
ncbi:MAG: TonB-dependent receptor [Prolixibacteraceae bacterium]|nr:TonB-dependent receptor [Prolixibacteraceae bacterium]